MAKTKQRRGASIAKKIASKPLTKSVSRKAKTRSRVNKKAKHANTTRKTSGYSKGVPNSLLKVAYNGVGGEFVFALTNMQGKVTSEFHISGDNILQSMGIPIMVLPSS